ncbi:ExbD/TolR family protein [Fuerstiella marisgermanici]|uniref:Biopolymer transport protein n=1 Tax=Fuerstiella marisgermanici TaxID=1891926 RepID=A0A1P8WIF7_9PLAN|nr:biopolymer transporter ExbD [Fuerstiella marisgermanici]APZ93834.1 Biopolymer transport protein [Fuerstiella marisgermanici]
MRIPGHHQRRTTLDNDSMTPMIDVVFLLLVFFVCASIGQKPESLLPAALSAGATETDVQLPPPDPTEFQAQEVRIRLANDAATGRPQIQLNEQPIADAAELTSRLKRLAEIDPRSQIILFVDDDASNQQFIGIYDLCQVLAFESISFAVTEAAVNSQ